MGQKDNSLEWGTHHSYWVPAGKRRNEEEGEGLVLGNHHKELRECTKVRIVGNVETRDRGRVSIEQTGKDKE